MAYNDLYIVTARVLIDPDDLLTANGAMQLLGVTTRSSLEFHHEQFFVIRLARTHYYSRAAIEKYLADRPEVLRPADVAKILGVTSAAVRMEPLQSALAPTRTPWGAWVVRTYDPDRVERVRLLREEAKKAGGRFSGRDLYRELLTDEQVVPCSVGLTPTISAKSERGKPRQKIKAKNGKADRIAQKTERVKHKAADKIDRRKK